MEKHLHPNYLKSSRLILLSGGIYILQELFSKDIRSVESNHWLAVIVTGLLIFGISRLVKNGHGWMKYLFLACVLLSLFMERPVSEEVIYTPLEMISMAVVNLLNLWAIVLLFLIPRKDKMVGEQDIAQEL